MLKTIRKIHFFIGVLFAPTIVFFAISGALQILRLHESSGGEPPSAIIAKLAQIHKDQIVGDVPRRKPRPAPAAEARPASGAEARPAPAPESSESGPHRSVPLMIWFLLMATGLLVSTGLGIYLAFAYKHSRILIAALLGAGTLIPLLTMLM